MLACACLLAGRQPAVPTRVCYFKCLAGKHRELPLSELPEGLEMFLETSKGEGSSASSSAVQLNLFHLMHRVPAAWTLTGALHELPHRNPGTGPMRADPVRADAPRGACSSAFFYYICCNCYVVSCASNTTAFLFFFSLPTVTGIHLLKYWKT